MSTPDQLPHARISGVCGRHCAWGQIHDLDQAVAELQEVAGDGPDLLAEHAGVCLGWVEVVAPDLARRCRAEAGHAGLQVPTPSRSGSGFP